MRLTATYTLVKVTGKQATIKFDGTISANEMQSVDLKMNGTQTGEMIVDVKTGWLIGIIIFAVRSLCLFAGISLGAAVSRAPQTVRRFGWLGFITQAGVGLGLANEVMRRFPDWGPAVATVIIAVISINQVVGPITFKYALLRSDEIRAGK